MNVKKPAKKNLSVPFELHEKAKARYNQVIDGLLERLARSKKPLRAREPEGFQPYRPRMITLEGSKLISTGRTLKGKKTAQFFEDCGAEIGLEGEDWETLAGVARSIFAQHSWNRHVTSAFIQDSLFNWLRLRYQRVAVEPKPIDFLIRLASEDLSVRGSWIPISETYIEEPIWVGSGLIVPLDASFKEKWGGHPALKGNVKELETFYQLLTANRVEGLAAAFHEFEASADRAIELTRAWAEQIVSLLRFFSGALIDFHTHPLISLLGSVTPPSRLGLTASAARLDIKKGLEHEGRRELILDKERTEMILKMGLAFFAHKLATNEMSKLERRVLRSIHILSKSGTCFQIEDRLIYLFSGVESMLLGNKQESISESIASRMAFCLSKKKEERLAIVSRVRSAYALRSKFFHHGKEFDEADIKLAEEFAYDAWRLFAVGIIPRLKEFNTKDEFLAFLEGEKYS